MPILMLSGNTFYHHITPEIRERVHHFFTKPVEPELLIQEMALIDQCLSFASVNLRQLRKITSSHMALMKELIDTFIENAPHEMQRIRTHTAAADWVNLYKAIHKAAPNFHYVAGYKLCAWLQELEEDVMNQQNVPTYQERINMLEAVTRQLLLRLQIQKSNLKK